MLPRRKRRARGRDQMLVRCRRLIERARRGVEENKKALAILRPLDMLFTIATASFTFLATAFVLSSYPITAAVLAILAGILGALQSVLGLGYRASTKQNSLKLQKIALEAARRVEDSLLERDGDFEGAEEGGIRDRIASISEFLSALEED